MNKPIVVMTDSNEGQGYVYTIPARLPQDVWAHLKGGSNYISREMCEDMDWFDTEPGWYYNLDAISSLLDAGHPIELRIRQETHICEDADQLMDLFTRDAINARADAERQRKEAAEAARRERAAEAQRKRDAISAQLERIRRWPAVERFDASELILTTENDMSSQHLTMYDRVYTGTINGVPVAYYNHYTGGHDYYDHHEYRCQKPCAAGLEVIATDDRNRPAPYGGDGNHTGTFPVQRL